MKKKLDYDVIKRKLMEIKADVLALTFEDDIEAGQLLTLAKAAEMACRGYKDKHTNETWGWLNHIFNEAKGEFGEDNVPESAETRWKELKEDLIGYLDWY